MASILLNLKLDYSQVLELVRQLSDEDNVRLKDELISDSNKVKLKYFQNLFSSDESEQLTMDEILKEVNEFRRERYGAHRKDESHS